MEAPRAYIPIDRRLALVRGAAVPDRVRGTVLFADISGFSPLTAALAAELGPRRGAEEVLRRINPVYDALIDRLHHFGGSVIGFAGDSITCWLEDDEGARALACALEMQAAMAPFATLQTPGGQPFSLAIKVAVASGSVRRFTVGDPQVQIMDVLAGETLDRMALGETMARKGEVIASAEVVAALGEAGTVSEWREDEASGARFAIVEALHRPVAAHPWPDTADAPLAETAIRPWLLPPIYARLQRGSGFLGELRPAVALFLRFGGLDYDGDDDAGHKLDGYVRWVQSVLERYEGYLLQLTMGDKGSYIYATFGAPLAHEDDPQRAVAAALALHNPPPALDFVGQVQIGISQGQMWTGACGSDTRQTYGVMGNEVNLAARLMTRARPGETLVSQRVAAAVAGSYRLHDLGTFSIKGHPKPIPVSAVLGRQRQGRHGLRFYGEKLVGREDALQKLARITEKVAGGSGQVVRLEGPAGIGKSHLASVFVEEMIHRDWQVLTGVNQSMTQGTPYTPWQQIFRELLALEEAEAGGEEGGALVERQIAEVRAYMAGLNPDWVVRLPVLGDLLDLPIPDNATTTAFEPQMRQRALFTLVAEMLQAWAQERPSILLLEDAHWMDQASWELALSVARALAGAPVLLLLVERPVWQRADEERTVKRYLDQLDEQCTVSTIALGDLDPAGIGNIARQRLQGEIMPVTLSLIQAKAQGNPFYVQELVDALREGEMIYRREDGRWALAGSVLSALRSANCLVRRNGEWEVLKGAPLATVDVGVPGSIQGIVLSRIDRMPESHKLTLKVASVIGQTFELDLLARAHPSHPADATVRQHIQEMEVRDFVHLLLQAAGSAGESLGLEAEEAGDMLQRELQRVAATMDDFMTVAAEEGPAGERAFTYAFKHNTVQEVAYNTLLFAQRRQLHQAVAQMLQQMEPEAIERLAYHFFLGGDWRRALHYELLAGRQAQQLFANYQAIEHFRRALQSTGNLPAQETRRQRQRIHAALGELLTSTGQYAEAEENLQTALALAEELGNPEAQANACRWLARAYELQGEYAPALTWIQKGLLRLDSEEVAEAAELLLIAGLINLRQGENESALALAEHGRKIAEDLANTTVLARAYNLLGIIARVQGRGTEAIESYFSRALALNREADNILGQAMTNNEIATAYFYMSQWSDADRYYRRARRVFRQVGDVYNTSIADNNLGGIALNQGRLDEALDFYRHGLQAQRQIGGSPWILGVFHNNMGATYIRQGDAPEALAQLRISRQYFEQVQARDFLPELYRHLAQAMLLAGEPADAAQWAQKAVALARELGVPGEEGQNLRVAGEIAIVTGAYEQARADLEASAALLAEVGDGYGEARTYLALADLHAARGEGAAVREALARCEPVLARLEAALDLEKVRALRRAWS